MWPGYDPLTGVYCFTWILAETHLSRFKEGVTSNFAIAFCWINACCHFSRKYRLPFAKNNFSLIIVLDHLVIRFVVRCGQWWIVHDKSGNTKTIEDIAIFTGDNSQFRNVSGGCSQLTWNPTRCIAKREKKCKTQAHCRLSHCFSGQS